MEESVKKAILASCATAALLTLISSRFVLLPGELSAKEIIEKIKGHNGLTGLKGFSASAEMVINVPGVGVKKTIRFNQIYRQPDKFRIDMESMEGSAIINGDMLFLRAANTGKYKKTKLKDTIGKMLEGNVLQGMGPLRLVQSEEFTKKGKKLFSSKYVLEIPAKGDDETSMEMDVDTSTWEVSETRYYDKKKKLIEKINYRKYEKLEGVTLPSKYDVVTWLPQLEAAAKRVPISSEVVQSTTLTNITFKEVDAARFEARDAE